MTAESIEHVAQLFEEHGSIVWWKHGSQGPLARRIYSSRFSKRRIYQGTDIMDVWFDSGLIMEWCSGQPSGVNFTRTDLYLEGSDQ